MKPNIKRNLRLVKLRDKNPELSFTELGKIFKIKKQTAHAIYHVWKGRQGLSTGRP